MVFSNGAQTSAAFGKFHFVRERTFGSPINCKLGYKFLAPAGAPRIGHVATLLMAACRSVSVPALGARCSPTPVKAPRQALGGCTKSSMTASAFWRVVMEPASD
jgi:hypothetical protein